MDQTSNTAGAEARSYYFGDFELDLGARQLRLRGDAVHLERRPFELLVLLVSHHGQLVRRDDVIRNLWPSNVVIDFDTGLNTLVRKIRRALGDSPEQPAYVETVTGVGYRFVAPVRTDRSPSPAAPAAPSETAAAVVTNETAAKAVEPRHRSRWPALAAVLLAVMAVAIVGIRQLGEQEPERTSIALLPFENLTGNSDLDYLAAGLAEETSLSLSRIDLPNLAVIGGVSARAITDSVLPLQAIGLANNIDYIVQSSLRVDGSRLRVTSRLIRVADSEQIWSASFDRALTNVLSLQRELSISIAEQIRQRLSPDVAAAIDSRQTSNPEAFELYLRGRYEWTQFLPGSISRALDYYRRAVIEDPGYALAWAGMAHALITSTVTVAAKPQSVRAPAQDALQRALEFGPDLAETQLALGSFHFFLDGNIPAAVTAARQAVVLDPNSAMNHMFLGIVLAWNGEYVEARAMLQRARELDPLSPLTFANSANVALVSGDPQSALEFATQAIAINPQFWVGYLHLGGARLALGNLDAALEAYRAAEEFSGGTSKDAIAAQAFVLARLGRIDEARDVLAELIAQSQTSYVAPYSLAIAYASVGNIDAAYEQIEKSCAEGFVLWRDSRTQEMLAPLHSDIRYETLLASCGNRVSNGSD